MPPKRKQAPEPDVPIATKKLRSRAVPFPVELPTKFDTTTSRRDQLTSSPRKASKASVKADTNISSNEFDDISNVVSEPPEGHRQLPKARVTRVYGKAGKQKTKAITQDSHAPEVHSSAQLDPPVRRQSRRGTGIVAVVVAVAKAPAKKSTKRGTTLTANSVEPIIPAANVPLRRTSRRTTSAAIVAETDLAVDEPSPKAPPKKATKRKTTAAIVESDMDVDAYVVKTPKKRTTRRTYSTADTDMDANSLPEVTLSEEARRQTSSEPPQTAAAVVNSMVEEPVKTNNNLMPFSDVADINEDVDIAAPKSPLKKIAMLATFDANGDSLRDSYSPPHCTIPQIPEFNEASSILPIHLHACFHAQKRAIMRMLQRPTCDANGPKSEDSVNDIAVNQLADLIKGTVERAEGNSCLLLGPRGSGKSAMVERCLDSLPSKPVVLRLSGWVQNTDRHALREIAIQLLQQTGSALLSEIEVNSTTPPAEINQDEDNPFLDKYDDSNAESGYSTMSLPPSSHLHSLIPALLTLKRPVIVILDAFDLFALHPRQSLLYCLLDTVQNCRASSESRGIAVIGVTSRLDTIQLLEKRVKSRFSGRTIRTAPPNSLDSYLSYARVSLQPFPSGDVSGEQAEWNQLWSSNVDKFLADDDVLKVFKETFSINRELTVVTRILTKSVLLLDLGQPYLSHKTLLVSAELQRSRPPILHVDSLSYPAICLVIASVHLDTSGQTSFTFEMLFEIFRDQVRASQSAPVQVNGGSIGMVSCTREVSMSAFENLISARIFIHISGPSTNTSKEFMKYRCVLDKAVITKLVEQSGQINLKKWHGKAK